MFHAQNSVSVRLQVSIRLDRSFSLYNQIWSACKKKKKGTYDFWETSVGSGNISEAATPLAKGSCLALPCLRTAPNLHSGANVEPFLLDIRPPHRSEAPRPSPRVCSGLTVVERTSHWSEEDSAPAHALLQADTFRLPLQYMLAFYQSRQNLRSTWRYKVVMVLLCKFIYLTLCNTTWNVKHSPLPTSKRKREFGIVIV